MAPPSKPLPPSPLVMYAALASLIALHKNNLAFAFCGEMGAYLYGEGAPTWTFEILLLSAPHATMTKIKRSIIMIDPNHFVDLPTSNSLCYYPRQSYRSADFFVIIITIPSTPHPVDCIQLVNGFPVAPFSFLLLQKLQEWDHVNSLANEYLSQESPPAVTRSTQEKEWTLAHELLCMLRTFRARNLRHYPHFDPALHTSSNERAARFLTVHSSYRKEWLRMGFLTQKPPIGHDVRPKAPSASSQASFPKPHNGQPVGSASLQVGSSNHQATAAMAAQETTPKAGSPLVVNGQPRTELASSTNAKAGPSSLSNTISSTTTSSQKPNRTQPSSSPPVTNSTTPANAAAGSSNRKEKAKDKPPRITFMQIRRLAAHTAVAILRSQGFECAIFGSMACRLYGNPRIPNDVDILVIPPPSQIDITQEDIKDLIVAQNPSQFVLKAAKDPEATYRVLYFTVSAKPSSSATPTTLAAPPPRSKSSKVDILLPGIMHLPSLLPVHITWKAELPLVPYDVLVLQKLQGWDDHRNAEEERYRKKAVVDVEDLQWILDVGISRHMRRGRSRMGERWSDRELFVEEFETLSRARVRAFCAEFPRFGQVWNALGFDTREA
ncbi:hypothetical protein Hypma_001273 [Hypsizygus marmoreus]|uniref:Uncharacterized protein n=1 Tax=Hypsizygus marmoreus TaxID=39966 RepID=A0A369J6H4_HYPMA|nr:hypothetical protein Hypma_001273 [Hypsizygus marmoreus]